MVPSLQIVADLEVANFCVHKDVILPITQLAEHYESHYKHTKKIRIRISGDGASYSRTSKFCLPFLETVQLSVVKVRITKANKCVNVHRDSACIKGIFIMLIL